MVQKRLPKSRRAPEAIAPLALTERSLEVVRAIARYRFLSTSTLVKLAVGNEDVTHRHLQSLYHRGIVSRLTIPRSGHRGEFIYFLENAATLKEIAPRLAIEIDWEQVRINHERYSEAVLANHDGVGQFLFLRHELMISDFRASLEIACRASKGRVELARWEQGASIWRSVRLAPRLTLPFRPDALLTLRLPNAPEGQQNANFFYEADRGTTSLPRFKQKLEAYLHFLKQGLHTEAFGIRKVRAVLVETITDERAEQCRDVASELADTELLAGMLFWFATAKELSTDAQEEPFHPHWLTAGDRVQKSVLD
jgi:hypothetical protein